MWEKDTLFWTTTILSYSLLVHDLSQNVLGLGKMEIQFKVKSVYYLITQTMLICINIGIFVSSASVSQ